jgi:SulP family sulfate permease
VLDAATVPSIDVTAAEALAALGRQLRSHGVGLLIGRDIGQVRDLLDESDDTFAGSYRSVQEAVAAVEAPGTA